MHSCPFLSSVICFSFSLFIRVSAFFRFSCVFFLFVVAQCRSVVLFFFFLLIFLFSLFLFHVFSFSFIEALNFIRTLWFLSNHYLTPSFSTYFSNFLIFTMLSFLYTFFCSLLYRLSTPTSYFLPFLLLYSLYLPPSVFPALRKL